MMLRVRMCVCLFMHRPRSVESDGSLRGRNISLDSFQGRSLGWRLISNSWLESIEEQTHLHNARFQLTMEPNHRFEGNLWNRRF